MITTELIARLEAAEAGSRELDAKIARHLAGCPEDLWFDFLGTWSTDHTIPPFTTSLDDTLALAERVLPKGWTVEIKTGARPFNRAIIHPTYRMENKQDRCPMGLSKATAALALCIAIVRAKETL